MISSNLNNTVNSTSPLAISNFSNVLYDCINKHYNTEHDELVILCIGTDRSTGDCLGPLIGHKLVNLVKKYEKKAQIGNANI